MVGNMTDIQGTTGLHPAGGGEPADALAGAAAGAMAGAAPEASMTGAEQAAWAARVRRLAAERGAVILAHNYQRPEIQDVADHVGDSLALARLAAASSARVIVLCGVYLMAETAKILCPERTVLIPDAGAGCSLADSITAAQLRAWKAEHPDAAVVAYVNTSAEVKALSDVCCTSANAAEIVSAIPASREVLFLPDQFLGAHVRRVTGRENLRIWAGECHVHAGISPQALRDMAAAQPEAELYVHPECGCGTSALWQAGTGDLPAERTRILSTGGMLAAARSSRASAVLVATETGMLHQLRKANPAVRFEPVNPHATCHYMKMITAGALERCLRDGTTEVHVDPETAARARHAVEAMIATGPAPAGVVGASTAAASSAVDGTAAAGSTAASAVTASAR
jgi:quinolinate synthase